MCVGGGEGERFLRRAQPVPHTGLASLEHQSQEQQPTYNLAIKGNGASIHQGKSLSEIKQIKKQTNKNTAQNFCLQCLPMASVEGVWCRLKLPEERVREEGNGGRHGKIEA